MTSTGPGSGEPLALPPEYGPVDASRLRYAGCLLAGRYARKATPAFVDHLARWITTDPWWDTCDPLARNCAGEVVRRHPRLARPWTAGWPATICRKAIRWILRDFALVDPDAVLAFVEGPGAVGLSGLSRREAQARRPRAEVGGLHAPTAGRRLVPRRPRATEGASCPATKRFSVTPLGR